ncbi:MAG: sigma 54-interacting transcriptional regulator, partial [Myxococcales bacterium]
MNTETTMLEEEGDGAAGEPGVLHVLVMSPDAFVSVPLPTVGTVEIGRSSKCAVRLDDPLASREHARFHVHTPGAALQVEDLHSANGTRVRDRLIDPGALIEFAPGEAIIIGSTVVMVQQNRPAVGLRRLWSHAYFESRLEDECARTATTSAEFALVRVAVPAAIPWTTVVPVLVKVLPAPHLFAAYGPRDYEILFIELPPEEVISLVGRLMSELGAMGIEAREGTAWHPRDGRTADALLARANALVKHPQGHAGAPDDGDGADAEPDAAFSNAAGMERIRELAKRAAASAINVLILGETGVGKDVLARTIHRLSGRKGAFVALNCAGLSPSLIESELFGHERGAFSGAVSARIGLLEAGQGGTVFLDEIGEMPLSLQSRLLRAIDNHEVVPVGGVKPRSIDVRFLAATNRDLEAEVQRGAFRQDLFFRLNTMTLTIPALRERTDEIPALAATFIQQACREAGRQPIPVITPAALRHMLAYAWPGNIRELKNVLERALVLSDAPQITPSHLPLDKMRSSSRLLEQPLRLTEGAAAVMVQPQHRSRTTTPVVPVPTVPALPSSVDLERLPPLDD